MCAAGASASHGLHGKSCLCPVEGGVLGEGEVGGWGVVVGGVGPCSEALKRLLRTASLDADEMAPLFLACCSSVLVQSLVWGLGRAGWKGWGLGERGRE